ncbi:hypothetical protein GNP81_10900 [Aliivibrio fischeri]|uniref:Uncharacterized protein n=1 Tax=Aliivibrio fischeri TaxID=668 RepID=A0A6I3YWU8_ALIFS|nr:hypothetical protein [Aliivibrio fischeri]MUK46745.1 hypothetical protein [Aliivibrio fischeri]MUK63444.1 hypothetical protein [Aliivibrio fischeri]MUK70516.1 hypothetical protein [Aliivibrio fischeri]MUK73936.1 hypothetical protein [Aliivibrio fischeri]MUK77284.1 hypothetical protein [Aliivibrio fischeri]
MKKQLITATTFSSFLSTIALVLLINAVSINIAYAKDNWVLIGDKTVNFEQEEDKVEPLPFLSERKFSKIKIKCVQGTVSIKSMKVTMTDGSTKQLKTMGTLTKGMSTRTYKLPGTDKSKFDFLELQYKSWGNLTLNAAGMVKKAKVEVWGLKR